MRAGALAFMTLGGALESELLRGGGSPPIDCPRPGLENGPIEHATSGSREEFRGRVVGALSNLRFPIIRGRRDGPTFGGPAFPRGWCFLGGSDFPGGLDFLGRPGSVGGRLERITQVVPDALGWFARALDHSETPMDGPTL